LDKPEKAKKYIYLFFKNNVCMKQNATNLYMLSYILTSLKDRWQSG
jgi:hypothetical protein